MCFVDIVKAYKVSDEKERLTGSISKSSDKWDHSYPKNFGCKFMIKDLCRR